MWYSALLTYLPLNISLISNGLQLLVTNLESGCDAALVTMTKVTKAILVYLSCCVSVGCLATYRGSRRPE